MKKLKIKRNKNGQFAKGTTPLFGFKKGYKMSEEHRRKISEGHTGLKHSELSKLKRSLRLKGNSNSHQIGIHHSIETKQKISASHKKLVLLGIHPSWKGGISSLNNHIRQSFKYRQWRSDIFTKNDFSCQMCGQQGGKLQVDHIKPFAVILKEYKIKSLKEAESCEELWNINNGRTLCIPCHKSTDTFAGKTNKISIYRLLNSNIS